MRLELFDVEKLDFLQIVLQLCCYSAFRDMLMVVVNDWSMFSEFKLCPRLIHTAPAEIASLLSSLWPEVVSCIGRVLYFFLVVFFRSSFFQAALIFLLLECHFPVTFFRVVFFRFYSPSLNLQIVSFWLPCIYPSRYVLCSLSYHGFQTSNLSSLVAFCLVVLLGRIPGRIFLGRLWYVVEILSFEVVLNMWAGAGNSVLCGGSESGSQSGSQSGSRTELGQPRGCKVLNKTCFYINCSVRRYKGTAETKLI